LAKTFKSEIVDGVILTLEERLKQTGRHLMKTDTILRMCADDIDLTDDMAEREELLEIGMRQVIQSRLYTHGYFSVQTGYFVNIAECENLWYLGMLIENKDGTIRSKIDARNRIKELKEMAGTIVMVPDEHNEMFIHVYKTKEEIIDDLEADAV